MNAFGFALDDASLRRAAVEGVPETVIAAISLLHVPPGNPRCTSLSRRYRSGRVLQRGISDALPATSASSYCFGGDEAAPALKMR